MTPTTSSATNPTNAHAGSSPCTPEAHQQAGQGRGARKPAGIFEKVSEWMAAGNMKSGFYLLERVEKETELAVGFKAQRYNAAGHPKPAVCWIAKSLLQEVANDFYTEGPARMFLLPAWLYGRKGDEGFEL